MAWGILPSSAKILTEGSPELPEKTAVEIGLIFTATRVGKIRGCPSPISDALLRRTVSSQPPTTAPVTVR